MLKPLDESTLFKLTNEAFASFLGCAEGFEAALHPECGMVLCGEPVADLNCVTAGAGADATGRFEALCRDCLSRELPFLAMVFPAAGAATNEVAEKLGLVFAVEFPFMVRDDAPIEPSGNDTVQVRRWAGDEGLAGCARVLSSAFNMPEDSVRRSMPATLMGCPDVDVFLATLDGEPVGSVTVTYHGETCGIWAMGTDTAKQRGGIGRRLLSSAMAEARKAGGRRFFLGATPAGYRLYESLGFTTRFSAKVWVSGVTHQA